METVAEDGCAYTADGSYAVFGALPGEKVIAVPVARKRKRLYLRSTEVLTSSRHRVTPMCKAASFCGGCSFQHASHAYQLELKQAQVQQDIWSDCAGRMDGTYLCAPLWLSHESATWCEVRG